METEARKKIASLIRNVRSEAEDAQSHATGAQNESHEAEDQANEAAQTASSANESAEAAQGAIQSVLDGLEEIEEQLQLILSEAEQAPKELLPFEATRCYPLFDGGSPVCTLTNRQADAFQALIGLAHQAKSVLEVLGE